MNAIDSGERGTPSAPARTNNRLMRDLRRPLTAFGFDPGHAPDGSLDQLVPEEIRPDVHAVLREALANVGRHSQVTEVTVEVTADFRAGRMRLVVRDDGRCVPGGPPSGPGLADLATRALRRGGGYSVLARADGGTEICWTVPLRAGESDRGTEGRHA